MRGVDSTQGDSPEVTPPRSVPSPHAPTSRPLSYAAIVASAADAVIGLDLAGSIVSWNSGAESLLGYPPDAVLGSPSRILFDLPPDQDGDRRPHSTGEVGMFRADGSVLLVSATCSAVLDDAGIPIGTSIIARDFSDQAQLRLEAGAQRDRLAAAQAIAAVGILETDLATGARWWTDQYREILAVPVGQAPTGPGLIAAVHPLDRKEVIAVTSRLWRGGAPVDVQFRILAPHGEVRWARYRGDIVRDEAGRPTKILSTILDVTALRRAQDDRADAQQLLQLAFDGSAVGSAITDLDARVVRVNRALCRMLDRAADEVVGQRIDRFLHPEELPRDVRVRPRNPYAGLLSSQRAAMQLEQRFLRPDGEGVWAQTDVSLVRGPQGEPTAFFLQTQDIGLRKQSEAALSYQAFHDALTDLPNRLLVEDRIEHALARAARADERVIVLFLDIDRFKVVNDSLGHAAGDALLRLLAVRLRGALRSADTLGRFGGDEFVIVCEDARDHEGEEMADRIATLMEQPFELDGREVTASVSVGIAVARPGDGAEALLRNADSAMYRAKDSGRARAVVFDERMHEQAAARLDTESGLRRALERSELVLYYQPLVDVATERVTGLEALIRWNHPDGRIVAPWDFMAIAEDTGMIVPIGAQLLRDALAQVSQWRRDVPDAQELTVAVNLSARQLAAPNLVEVVASAIADAALPAAAVHLEITESVVMADVDRSIEMLSRLRALGVRLAIDDFGTGYSSLSYLRRLPLDALKIDRSFIAGLGDSGDHDRSIVHAIISLARALHLDVVAEGVETAAQLAELRSLGCPRAQGFLWGRPMPPSDMSIWLASASLV